MKKRRITVLAGCVILLLFLLAGCGGRSGSASYPVTDSAIQKNAQDIQKMLTGIEDDTAEIKTDDGTSDSVDSTIDEINSALNGGQDDISGLNE